MLTAKPKRAKLPVIDQEILQAQAETVARAQMLFAPTSRDPRTGVAMKLLPGEGDVLQGISLLGCLKKLNITPFQPGSVRRYQAAKIKHWQKFSPGKRLARYVLVPITWTFILGFPTLMVVTHGNWDRAAPIILTIISVAAGIAAAVAAFDSGLGRTWDYSREWHSHELSKYGIDRLPTFALETAVRIKESIPDVTFDIEYLEEFHQERQKEVRVNYDPFLVVKRGSETYYVECWDELDFERLI